MKIKKPPRRRATDSSTEPAAATDAQILALFRKAEAAWKASTRQLDAALREVEVTVAAARNKVKNPRAAQHADKLELAIARVRNAVDADNAADAALLAIRLTQAWLRSRYQ
ncbi:MAG: hypothetical protein ABI859_19120 [Pseudomonadota bacterium]